ncbi:MAG TPA: histidine kinase [Flavobacteriaceae bacterium]|mgnify:CR=1 FL=1|nr:histidine kinase [Flavobacteriaceae bacterium]MAY53655.1 histidine kinase [Flavobacteriaceae bacterium]HBR54850.1 histidine kinase [Flavobacteriaceae bacterium]|tara:strand:- start:250 stop:1161 length:912 start_codon:yes stop_codon:yes gene_type:complete
MDTKLLDKWLNGTHSAEDLQKLETDPAFAAYQKIDRFSKQIEIPEFDTEASLAAVKDKIGQTKQKNTKVRTLPLLLKIAAVLVIVFATYMLAVGSSTNVQTQFAETITIALPDTSEVVLNENSEISYKKNSWDESRELSLTGEAFFKVAKGKKFTVQTPNGDVTVLGTEFNVTSNGTDFSVSCYEGLVAVTHKGKTANVAAGNHLTIENGELISSAVYVNKPEWVGNESSYNDVLITNVLQDLERKYNITVAAQNIDVTLRFTGSFTHKDLEAALQTITLPLGLTYAIESEKNVIISPTQATK